ncbi:AraC family transcriptional regulator [Amycolatopsis rubida]|uniref:AraC family transcriptional regulator n=1 Tax=Amycolatopsis rubida TaxID=112413 RepID=A0ABX0BML3_9PSEU|nr:AraC family transcriptional regulator [Amycolatopsis sp. M39]MYW90756.1 helix-turn-helix domain-containing protein [Amycolatopsis rubida]NEC55739.1 AraC family transcriptional regulator [Amycolatopsis rubida]
MDILSEAIAAMRAGRPSSNRLRVDSPWCYRFDRYDGAGFHVLLRGTGWLITEHGAPTPLATGDVVLIPRGSTHVLSDSPRAEGAVPFDTAVADPDGQTDFLCGKYRLDHTRIHPLLAELPEVVHVPAQLGRHPELRAALDLLASEATGERPGRDTVISGLLDLLLTYLVRAWLDKNTQTGWPRALHDREIAAALQALHTNLAAPWRIEDLAAEVGLSRATLARRFTALTGQPLMTYLTWWRMITAARLLRTTDQPLPAIAQQVGYSSPFAFSHAFKRHYGVSPGRYQRQPVPDP